MVVVLYHHYGFAAENDEMGEIRQDRWPDWVFNSHRRYVVDKGMMDLVIMITLTQAMYEVGKALMHPPSIYSGMAWPSTTLHHCEVLVLQSQAFSLVFPLVSII